MAPTGGAGHERPGPPPAGRDRTRIWPRSARRHLALARRAGVAACLVRLPTLAFDVDTPDDLARLRRYRRGETGGCWPRWAVTASRQEGTGSAAVTSCSQGAAGRQEEAERRRGVQLSEAVRRRRMVRAFTAEPVPWEAVERCCVRPSGRRAPGTARASRSWW